jgi:hypothetical protein
MIRKNPIGIGVNGTCINSFFIPRRNNNPLVIVLRLQILISRTYFPLKEPSQVGCSSAVDHLVSMYKALGSIPSMGWKRESDSTIKSLLLCQIY